jgi:hypothetical protein
LARLRAAGARVFRTDSCGGVVLETDGIETRIREWK